MWVHTEFWSTNFFGTCVFVILTISGIKSGGPPFFRDGLDTSLRGHILDFQIWPVGPAFPSPAPKPENFGNFTKKSCFFATKLRESTRNRSRMFSGGVGDVRGALSRVSWLSGVEKPPKFTKNQ